MVYTLSSFTRLSYQQAIANVPGMGTPSAEQLAKMQSHAPKGITYTADQFVSVPMVASHNLMSFSNGVWDLASLEAMARLFPGKPAQLNHNWDDIQDCTGLLYDAFLVRSMDAPTNILNASDFFDVNRQIVAKDGFIALIVMAAFPVESAVVDAIAQSRARGVSTGGLTTGEYGCPLCDLSFEDANCPHVPPHPMLLYYYGDDPDMNFAPYYIRMGFHTAIEVSLVVSGNLPGAEVLRA
jgi:hypothetical protein